MAQINSSLLKRFQETKYKLLEKKEDVPKSFFRAYKRVTKKDFLIANENEDFNFSDVETKGLPNRQMIFAGIDSTNTFGFIFFKAGGIVVSSQLLIFDIKSKRKPKFLPFAISNHPTNMDELKYSVKKNISL